MPYLSRNIIGKDGGEECGNMNKSWPFVGRSKRKKLAQNVGEA